MTKPRSSTNITGPRVGNLSEPSDVGLGAVSLIDDTPTPFAIDDAAPGVDRSNVRPQRAQMRRADGGWWSFDGAVGQVIAWELDEVMPALDRLETEVSNGRWAVGFISYDATPAFDRGLEAHRDARTPLVCFGLFDHAIDGPLAPGGPYRIGDWTPRIDRSSYGIALDRIHAAIAAGDTYQVNHTFRMDAAFRGDALGLFEDLVASRVHDHALFLDLDGAAVCSASPELFLRRDGRRVETAPMKGTRRRDPDARLDAALADELAASIKDRAENTMICDMMRNDLGRIAEIGSVRVTALHDIEHYPTVHQMVSRVVCDTDVGLVELLEATFPAASITGAPKYSTSRIITELEPDGRGVYCGAAGVISPDGWLELNVAIRTAWIDHDRGTATYGVGGGIVWDSDNDDEWAEAHTKARVLDAAAGRFELLETIAVAHGDPILAHEHIDRLCDAALSLGVPVDRLVLTDRLRQESTELGAGVLRLRVDRSGAVDVDHRPRPDPVGRGGLWALPIDPVPVRSDDPWLRHKTTERSRYDAARARFPDAPDVVLVNERGELCETTIGNLVLEIDGQLVTPHHDAGLLPGTLRAELLAYDKVSERVLTLGDLDRADAAFMINSVRGWVPVRIITD